MEGQYPPVTRREMIALAGTTTLAGCTAVIPSTRQTQQGTAQQEGPTEAGTQQTETVRAYVGSYHWGFFMLDDEGAELDQLMLSSGDELRLVLFNVEADAAVAALPQAVRSNIPSPDERARRNEEAIPVPQGTSLDVLHEAAEAAYPDHSLVILSDEFLGSRPEGPGQGPGSGGPSGPWGGHHGPHGGLYGPGSGWGRGPQGPSSSGPYGPGMPGFGPGMPGYGPGMHWGWGGGSAATLAPPMYLWHHSTVPSELGFVVDTTGSFGFACSVYCGYGHPYMAERSRIVVNEN